MEKRGKRGACGVSWEKRGGGGLGFSFSLGELLLALCVQPSRFPHEFLISYRMSIFRLFGGHPTMASLEWCDLFKELVSPYCFGKPIWGL